MNFRSRAVKFVKRLSMLLPRRLRINVGWIVLYVYSLKYRGGNVECPCCGTSLTEFAANFSTGEKDTMCPRCLSSPRHRLIQLYMKDKTNFFDSKLKVLHFAPIFAFQKLFEDRPNLDYLSVDINSPLVMKKEDINNISFPDNTFDVILCNHVLEHIEDDIHAMGELRRVLKPDGWAILLVPIDTTRETTFVDPNIQSADDRQKYYYHYDHKRLYGLDYNRRLESAGFTVKVDNYYQEISPDLIRFHGLSQEPIYLCTV